MCDQIFIPQSFAGLPPRAVIECVDGFGPACPDRYLTAEFELADVFDRERD